MKNHFRGQVQDVKSGFSAEPEKAEPQEDEEGLLDCLEREQPELEFPGGGTPLHFLARASSEDLLDKVPEIIINAKRIIAHVSLSHPDFTTIN